MDVRRRIARHRHEVGKEPDAYGTESVIEVQDLALDRRRCAERFDRRQPIVDQKLELARVIAVGEDVWRPALIGAQRRRSPGLLSMDRDAVRPQTLLQADLHVLSRADVYRIGTLSRGRPDRLGVEDELAPEHRRRDWKLVSGSGDDEAEPDVVRAANDEHAYVEDAGVVDLEHSPLAPVVLDGHAG